MSKSGPNQIIVVLNCQAGSASDKLKTDMLAAFDTHGLQPKILTSDTGRKLQASIDEAIALQPKTVVAAGGDGTISAVASKLAGSNIQLGVLPVGTLNHFAKDLGLPLKLAEAVAVIAHGKIKKIDYASVNGRPFINNSSIGIYPAIVRSREADEARIGKWPAAIIALWRSLRSYQNYQLTLQIDDKSHSHKTPLLFIGNNDYRIERVGIANRKLLDAGHLCVYVAKPTKSGDWLVLVWCMLTGRLQNQQQFDSYYPSSITVRSRFKHLRLAVDGEIVPFKSPFKFKVHPGELTVVVL